MFEEKYLSSEAEKRLKLHWAHKNVYGFDFLDQAVNNKDVFSVDTPPPTVSGSLHIGHIFSYLQTDFVARYRRMIGDVVYYPMGFDDNGLPTEKFVEKKLGKRSKEFERSVFIEHCLRECALVEDDFKNLWEMIGLSVDWRLCYSTISPLARKVSQRSFLRLIKKGLIYRRKEPALFCTEFRSTVAQTELEVVTKESFFNTIIFEIENGDKIEIATTRPELLPACVAIFVHPEGRHKNLIGKKVKVPLFGQTVDILGDDAVLDNKGTGIVMCCTFGDNQDVLWFKKHKLPLVEVIGVDGKMTVNSGFLTGLSIAMAREKVVEELLSSGLLVDRKKIFHDVHVYERSKKDIEYIVASQWFIKVLDFKQELLDFGAKVCWTPSFMFSRYRDWVENLTWDWCISRQRFFGIPFPVWHCSDCQEVLLPSEDMLPVDPQEKAYPGEVCLKCGGKNIMPDTDVMDTWATSASTPLIHQEILNNMNVGLQILPMSIRPQAHDIIRTWAFCTLAKTYHENKSLPWKNILISGHVLSNVGGKISKSALNSQVEPISLLENHSADSIRYWAAKGRLGVDTAFSQDQIKNGNRLITKLWNAAKFCSMNVSEDFFHDALFYSQVSLKELDALSCWVLSKLSFCLDRYHECFKNFDYAGALESVDQFFWQNFCDNYLEIVKDQVFNTELYGEEARQSYSKTLSILLLNVLKMYAPFIPFVTDHLFLKIFNSKDSFKSIHNTIFSNQFDIDQESDLIQKEFEKIIEIISAVRKLKSEHSLSLKTPIVTLEVDGINNLLKDVIVVKLLLGVCKSEKLVLLPQRSLEKNQLIENENGFVAKIVLL